MALDMRLVLLYAVLMALVLGQYVLPVQATPKVTGHTVEQKNAVEAVTQASYTRKYAYKRDKGRIRVIVQLEEAPLLEITALNNIVATQSPASAASTHLERTSLKEYQSFILRRQEAAIEQIKLIDQRFETDFHYVNSFNGFAGEVYETQLEKLSALPGVKAIHPDIVHYNHMDASLDIVNSMAVWEALGGKENAGKGIRVAVIDSGIRPDNPMFSGDNFEAPDPATLPDDDYCASVPSFCNNKLIVARFADIPQGFDVHVDEFTDSPLAFNGHGTHVAGIAVGNYGVIAERDGATAEISGVAPAAYLMVYKGLYATNDDPTRSSALSSMLLDMLESALNDGADVINNSWGSGAGESPAGSVYQTVLASIREAGIVNVFSAGNSGPGEVTIGCPACSDDVLSVGNTTTNRLFANEVSIPETGLAPIPAIFAGVVQLNSPLTAPIRYSAEVSAENIEGCDAFPSNAFNNQIALISRGTCTFAVKIANAEAAGAIAVLIHNQAGRGEAPFVMGGLSATQRIPSLMLPATPGLALAEYLVNTTSNTSATIGSEVIRTTSDSLADLMAESSSRGPGGDPSFLKPNLVAPGSRIFSAESPVAPNHVGEKF